MKRLISLLLCAVLCIIPLGVPAVAADPEVKYGGGSGEFYMEMDAAPFIENGRTYLPIRYVAEAFGIYTAWNDTAKTATLERGNIIVQLSIGSKTMTLINDGETSSVDMDVAPILRDGRTCLPVRFVAEAFGLDVGWQEDYFEEDSDGTAYRKMATVSEGNKTLYLTIGEKNC